MRELMTMGGLYRKLNMSCRNILPPATPLGKPYCFFGYVRMAFPECQLFSCLCPKMNKFGNFVILVHVRALRIFVNSSCHSIRVKGALFNWFYKGALCLSSGILVSFVLFLSTRRDYACGASGGCSSRRVVRGLWILSSLAPSVCAA